MSRKVDVFFSREDLETMLEQFPEEQSFTHFNTWSYTSKKGKETSINIFLGQED
jgi:hypothetical protein